MYGSSTGRAPIHVNNVKIEMKFQYIIWLKKLNLNPLILYFKIIPKSIHFLL